MKSVGEENFESAQPADLKRARRRRPAYPDAARSDPLPPVAMEAEQGVLGCLLLSPREGIPACVEKFRDGGVVFYDLRHLTIYEACVEMWDKQLPIDIITLQQWLKDKEMLDQVGGIAYLNALQDAVPAAANLSYYADIVWEKYQLRSMVNIARDVTTRIYESTDDFNTLLDSVERDLIKLTQQRDYTGLKDISVVVQQAQEVIESYSNRGGELTGIGTGFTDLDRMTSGLQGGEMIVIAARPSMGKTSLAMNIVEFCCVQNRIPTGVFSIEMTARSLVVRSICSLSRVNLRMVLDGYMSERDMPRMVNAMSQIRNSPLFIDDSSELSLLQLRSKARRMVAQSGIKLFVIDYLQLMSSGNRKDGRQQEVSDISKGIKALAKELGVPIIVLSQLNREVEKEKGRKPRLSDLRESGSIEQDADLVAFLYKPYRENEDEGPRQEEAAIPVNLLIAKQRNGPTGDVELTFLKPYTRFESAAVVSDDDVPTEQSRLPYAGEG